MSALLPLYKVTLMIGYELELSVRAHNEDAAFDIATYLFGKRYLEHFGEGEHMVISSMVASEEAAS